MSIRDPVVAGRFYPADPAAIVAEVAALFAAAGDVPSPAPAIAVMCPHAGWTYSGKLAARTLAGVEIPERVVALCPNHTGRGARVAVMARGAWRMPDRLIPIDDALAAAILDEARGIRGARGDEIAHLHEHAIEVLVPLLAARQARLRLTPIVVGGLDAAECAALGAALARAIAREAGRTGEPALVVASSDMSHYLSDAEARRRDALALDALATGDGARLLAAVEAHDVSMCGARPAAVMLAYARARGAGAPRLVGYATSGDASGDRARVVGYAGVVVPPS